MPDTPDAPRPVSGAGELDPGDHFRDVLIAYTSPVAPAGGDSPRVVVVTAFDDYLAGLRRAVRVVPPGAVVVERAEAEFVADFICTQRCGYRPKTHSHACEAWRAALRAWPKEAA